MLAEMQALCQLATVWKRAGNERKPPRPGKDICLVFMRLNVFCQGAFSLRVENCFACRVARIPICMPTL